MGQPPLSKATIAGARETLLAVPRAHADSGVWLARLFLLALLVTGLASLIAGVSPETMALCPCPFYFITHVKCPGCGMTRACLALARGDLLAAWNYHPFSFGLVLLAIGTALAPGYMRRSWLWLSRSSRDAIVWSFIILALGFWAYRLT